MVDWKNVGIPLITTILVVLFGGTAIINFLISAVFSPVVNIQGFINKDNNHKVQISLVNTGRAPANHLVLTIHSPGKISEPDIFSTENYTKNFNNKSNNSDKVQISIPRLVHGDGSLVNVNLDVDPNTDMTSKQFIAYLTYDQGSVRKIIPFTNVNIIPSPSSSISEPIGNIINNPTFLLAIIAAAIGILGFYISRSFKRSEYKSEYLFEKESQINQRLYKIIDDQKKATDEILKLLRGTERKDKQ